MNPEWKQFVLYLSPQEWLGLILVMLGSLALWSAELIIVGRSLRRALTGIKTSLPPRSVCLVIHLACLVYLITFLYARFVEPDKLALRRMSIRSEKIPAGLTLRIVQASDIHAQARRYEHLVRAAEAITDLRPDLVVLTGDFLCDYRHGAPGALLAFLLRLPDVPVYAVPGNYGGIYPADPFLEQIGIETLHTETRLFNVKGIPIELMGCSPTRHLETVPPPRQPERFGIFLEHFPALLPAAARAGWDLFLAGHTHGGQVRLPGYGAIITLDLAGKKFEYGGYRLNKTTGYVSAGLGMECRGAPQIRLFCPPEFTLIEIVGAAE